MLNIPHGTTLAFDFGETRIGVAQGDAEVGIAHPLATVSGEGNDKKFAAIAALVAEWRPVQFVVGLPFSTDGSEHEMTRLARKFGHRLNGRFGLPVYWADERLTSLYAAELLNQTGLRGHKQKSVLDQVAAQAILQGFFEGGWVEEFHG
ncbi:MULTISPECIES: Holliday junction resolvase RuvX [Eikenella]|uniref:Holliday junction resolvase RuvX n=1 Tax=Eikenella TaxID=538 RepID=UPI0007D0785B|nr:MULTISPECIES: Holliday junction resolvase RuvX [Eikenella]OAM31809.1 Holliday junction DNA helicase RuvA [Eikenella corrodens]OFN63309.1 crossover junction endodeoxyribonuclease RuvA [Eikenella sp. HMSC061C02]